jgi:amino acid adenylation domain-containing protein
MTAPASSVLARLWQQAQRRPEAPAILAPGRPALGFAALQAQVEAARRAFEAAGIGRADRVALALPNGPEAAVATLSVLDHAVAAPQNPAYGPADFEFYLGDLRPRALVLPAGTDSPARGVAAALGIRVIELRAREAGPAGAFDLDVGDARAAAAILEPPRADDVALVLHTSGTTSRPKVVPLRHANLEASASSIAARLRLGEDDRSLVAMPLFHIHGIVASLLAPLGAGAGVACPPVFQAPRFAGWLQELRPTYYSAVPTMHQALLARYAQDGAPSHALRFVRSSSSPLPPAVLAQLEALWGVPVVEAYGMTEASHEMASNALDRPRKPGSVGRPTGAEIRIAGAARPGDRGEIEIRGRGVTAGYDAAPEATAAAFRDGWFRTGDEGYFDADGDLFLTGRLKELINKGGEKIVPREVEDALLSHPGVEQAVVFALPDERLGEEVAAAVVRRAGAVAGERELQEHVAQRLAAFKVPRAFAFLDEIPKGPTGKVQRVGLAARLGMRSTERRAEDEPQAPRDARERALLALFAEVLGREVASVHESFFDLGGDSTLAMILLARAQSDLGLQLTFPAFWSDPTAAGAARALSPAGERPGGAASGDPSARFEPFPLTEVQEAYWVGRSGAFELGNVACHSYMEFDAEGVDLQRLEDAWNALVLRHEMLRAVVTADGRQRILPRVPRYAFVVYDHAASDAATLEAHLAGVREELSHQVLPADRWPLFDVRASLLPGGRARLHFSFDALILDAWSRALVFREWSELYRDHAAQRPPLEYSFRDYVLAEQAASGDAARRRARDYWLSRADSLPPGPELPARAAARSVRAPRFETLVSRLPAVRWRALKAHARQAGLTPAALLIAAFAEVLRVHASRPRFSLNLTVFNRDPVHPDVPKLAGDFTSLTLLECDAAAPDFEARARTLQERLWHDLEHRRFGAVSLLREMQKRGRPTLMPVVFTSRLNLDARAEEESPWAWLGGMGYLSSQTPQVSLDHSVWEDGGDLVFTDAVVEDLFPEGVPRALHEAFGAWLERLAADAPGNGAWTASRGDAARALVPVAQQEAIARANATARSFTPARLESGFARQSETFPARVAVIAPDRTLTYGELASRVRALARRLRDAGASPGTNVAIVMDKGWPQVVAALAIPTAGAAYVPVDASLPLARRRALLEDARARLVVTQESLAANLEVPEGTRTLVVPDAFEDAGPLPPLGSPDDLAYVIFTSGSTGRPKGVAIQHAAALNTIDDINARFRVGPADRVLALSSLGFDLSVWDLFGVLAAGGALVMPAPSDLRDPARQAALVREHGVTLWNSVPALAQLYVEAVEGHPERRPGRLRLALLSGDWIPLELPERLRAVARGVSVVSLGGATEASIWSIAFPIGRVDPAWRSIPYGRALANQSFHVLDADLAPRPFWTPGDLYIGGLGLAREYFGDPAKTAERFVADPTTGERLYRTGDRGRWRDDGTIEFLGREDLQVKVQGYRIELGEIEAALEALPGVRAAVAAAIGEAQGDRRLVGYVVAPGLRPEALRHALRAQLPESFVPSEFVFLDALPLSANGKVDRSALPPPGTQSAAGRPVVVPGVAGDAGSVASVVARVLKREAVDPDASLTALGATSVDVIRIANALENETGRRPGIDQLYRAASLRALAAALLPEAAAATPAAAPVRDVAALANLPLLKDPAEREAFKRRRPGLRALDGGGASVPLPTPEAPSLPRRSHRAFAAPPVKSASLGGLLAVLAAREEGEALRYRYGSAGGLYPIQAYLVVRPGGVEGVAPGAYYFDPLRRALVPTAAGDVLSRDAYGPLVNRPIFDASAFALFLVADLAAIAPLYGERSPHYATLEAGAITQLLEDEAPRHGLGLCQIGQLGEAALRDAFRLADSHVLVHSLVGGGALDEAEAPARPAGPPLSVAQERLWSVLRRDPGAAYFGVTRALRLRGPLDEAALEHALQRLVERQAVLRTTCRDVDGRPEQRVEPPGPVPLTRIDVRRTPDPALAAREHAAAEARRPVRLDAAPLLRATLVDLGPDDRVLVLATHLFAADGWGMRLLWRDLGALYAGAPLPALATSYAAYARDERLPHEEARRTKALDWWRSRLRGLAPLRLGSGTPARSLAGRKLEVALSPEATERLRRLAREENATLFVAVLAALAAELGARGGTDDLAVGTIVSNRRRSGAEDLAGNFGNNVALRLDLSGAPSFRQLVGRARETALDAWEHQEAPFERVVEALGAGAAGRTPVFQALLLLHDQASADAFEAPGLVASPFGFDEGLARYDVTLELSPHAGGLVGSLVVSLDVFDDAGAAALARALVARLESPETIPAPAARVTPPAASRTPPADVEARLTALFEELLGTRPVGPRQSFFDLGGHSLVAVRLLERIEAETGTALPMATLLETATVEGLAQRLRGPGPAKTPLVVPITAQAGLPPLYLVPGLGGNAFEMHGLARRLGERRACYGFQFPGAEDDRRPEDRVEILAARFLEEVRALQPRGPYRVAGYCLGAGVAYELSRTLREAGEDVRLALIDPPPLPLGARAHLLDRARVVMDAAWSRLKRGETGPAIDTAEPPIRQANRRALRHYKPRPAELDILLCLATQGPPRAAEDAEHAFRRLAPRGLVVHRFEGDHRSVLADPALGRIAAEIRRFLEAD